MISLGRRWCEVSRLLQTCWGSWLTSYLTHRQNILWAQGSNERPRQWFLWVTLFTTTFATNAQCYNRYKTLFITQNKTSVFKVSIVTMCTRESLMPDQSCRSNTYTPCNNNFQQLFTEVGEGLTFRSGGEVDLNVEVVCGEQVVRRRGGGGGGRGRGWGEETGVGCGLVSSTQGGQLLRGTQIEAD